MYSQWPVFPIRLAQIPDILFIICSRSGRCPSSGRCSSCSVPNGVRISEKGKLVLMDRQGVDILGEGRNTMEVLFLIVLPFAVLFYRAAFYGVVTSLLLFPVAAG